MAAESYASKSQWTVVIAIVDAGGNLVLLQRMDNTQIGGIHFLFERVITELTRLLTKIQAA